jgi:hypothetical protein
MFRTLLCTCLALLLPGSAALADGVLVVRSGTVADRKECGWCWDVFRGSPDPYVKVSVYEKKSGELVDYGETDVADDTYTPVWHRQIARVQEGDRVVIEVWDKDLKFDDLIGRHEFTLTRSQMTCRQFRVAFDQVEELYLEVCPDAARKPAGPGPVASR